MSKEKHPLESPNTNDFFVDFRCINEGDDATEQPENVDPFSTPSDQEHEEEEDEEGSKWWP